MNTLSDWMPYGETVRARDVALSLGWIAVIYPSPAHDLYRVNYVGKVSA